jgi:hypothetical protein
MDQKTGVKTEPYTRFVAPNRAHLIQGEHLPWSEHEVQV